MTTRSLGHRRILSVTGVAAVALAFILVGFAATASAQSNGKASIDFAFVAGKTECAAGTYNIEVNGPRAVLRQQGPKGETVVMTVITRLGRHDTDNTVELVFDKVNSKLILSEIWMANEDGYLVANTPGDHAHRVLGGSKPSK